MRLAVIVVHYFSMEWLAAGLAAVRQDLATSGLDADLLVVDNGSDAADRPGLSGLPVTLLTPGSNLGYAAALNLGAARTKADVLCFMNPDVEVLPGCLPALAHALRQGAAAAGPRFYWDREKRFLLPPTEERDRINEAIRRLARRGDWWAARARRRWRRHARRHWRARDPIESWSLSGALLAVQRDAWERVGPFDEDYRLYFEETDWLTRAHRAGCRAEYIPAAQAVHFYNQSAAHESAAARWMGESAGRFAERYYGRWFGTLLQLADHGPAGRAAAPPPLPNETPEIILDTPLHESARRPLWVEIAPSETGFPAAAEIIDETPRQWRLPEEVWQYLAPGDYYIQVVDDAGCELQRFAWTRQSQVRQLNLDHSR
jgi:GT2 family glycosyltransferase